MEFQSILFGSAEAEIVKAEPDFFKDLQLDYLIEKILEQRGCMFCEIIEKYNTVPKPMRIEAEKGIIKKQMVFPAKNTFGENTHVGKFMNNLTSYNSSGSNANDDGPDSCALFASEIIEENSQPQIAQPMMGIREYM